MDSGAQGQGGVSTYYDLVKLLGKDSQGAWRNSPTRKFVAVRVSAA